MPLIPFPDVPPFPGVPALAGTLSLVFDALLTDDDPSVSSLVADPQWGLFDDQGSPVVLADSTIAFEFMKEYRVSNYPIEEGSFASYNKVELPYSQRIIFAKGGSDADRAQFLSDLSAAEAALDLYTVITPDATFINANVVRVNYARHAQNGATLISAEVQIEEIRVAGDTTFKNTADPSGASPQSGGTVQPQSPTPAQSTAAGGGTT